MRTDQPIKHLSNEEKRHVRNDRCPWCGWELKKKCCYNCDEEFTEAKPRAKPEEKLLF